MMKHLHVSPFYLTKNGSNTIHTLCKSDANHDMLELLMLPKYKFYRPKNKTLKFNLIRALDTPVDYSL
jgi:hypothetical protein